MNLDLLDFGLVYFVIFIVFAVSTSVQLLFYWGLFSRLAFYFRKKDSRKIQPVSVVICAKNEYEKLKKNLNAVLEQDYPDYEVVVVNDASEDESNDLLTQYSYRYDHLHLVNIKEDLNFFTGKKFPLSIGIKSAKNDIILLTDADCKPAGKHWLKEMQSGFTKGKDIVIGYGAYEHKKGVLNYLIRFDAFHGAIQYLSYSLANMTYMGVGRNLAYRKSLFFKNKGFISHYKVKSGDDDLFINKVATENNCNIVISHNSHTISEPHTSFFAWIRQKRRHLSTAKYYKSKHKFLLSSYYFSQVLFYLSFIVLVSKVYIIIIILPLFFIRIITQLIIFKKSMVKLNERKLLLISPLLELFFIILNPILAFGNMIVKQNKWK